MDHVTLGRIGEAAAVLLLRRRGYRIIERNFRCAFGEIDLVAEEGDTVVFVEVKARTTADYGEPFDAITHRKQRRLTRLARVFLQGRHWLHRPARFDAVAVAVAPDGTVEQVDLLVNAFDACD